MGPRVVVLTFISAVAAVVAGFIGGGLAREAIGNDHEIAIGVVDAEVGAPIATSSPTPAPTVPPVETAAPSAEVSPEVSPSPDGSLEPCPGTPPRDGCHCRERRRNSRWVCPLL